MTIRIERIERSGEGAPGRAADRGAVFADPAVFSRVESRSLAGPCEVATSFLPSAERPQSYPADLPFVPYVEAHTNEYPDSGRPPRVRWVHGSDAGHVFDEVARASVAAGWRPDPGYESPAFHSAERTLFLRRGDRVRRILHYEFEGASIIEMEDVSLRSP